MEGEQHPDWVPTNTHLGLSVKLSGAEGELAGVVPGVLVGLGLTQKASVGDENSYDWLTPTPGPIALTSPLDPTLAAKFRIYSPDDFDPFTLVKAPLSNSDGNVVLYLEMTIRGEVPCTTMRLSVESLTPNVCTSTQGDVS